MENMAGQKINRFREKLDEDNRKHFDALVKYLQKNLEEFKDYKPDRDSHNAKVNPESPRIVIPSAEQKLDLPSAPVSLTNSNDLTEGENSRKRPSPRRTQPSIDYIFNM